MAKKRKAADGEAGQQGETMTKADAVRSAVADGITQPLEGVAHIKGKFGIDLTPQHFSSIKSNQKKKAGQGGRRGRKPGRVAAASGSSVNNGRSGGNPAELARQVKGLVKSYGAVAVSDMVKVFSD